MSQPETQMRHLEILTNRRNVDYYRRDINFKHFSMEEAYLMLIAAGMMPGHAIAVIENKNLDASDIVAKYDIDLEEEVND